VSWVSPFIDLSRPAIRILTTINHTVHDPTGFLLRMARGFDHVVILNGGGSVLPNGAGKPEIRLQTSVLWLRNCWTIDWLFAVFGCGSWQWQSFMPSAGGRILGYTAGTLRKSLRFPGMT